MLVSPRILAACLALIALPLSLHALACSGSLHIQVRDSGVYQLDYATIIAQQPLLADCSSDDLSLANRGKEVPIRVRGDAGGKFAPGSHIEWIGLALHGPESWFDQYSAVNVYQLTAAPGSHARMREVPAAASANPSALRRKLHFEQENLMLRLNDREMKPGQEPDVWQWAKLTPVDAQPFAYTFDIPDADLRPGPAADFNLVLDFRGVSNVLPAPAGTKPVDHVVEIALNGKPLPALQWDGRDEIHRDLPIARDLLREKGNVLTLRVPRRAVPGEPDNFIVDVAMFNWMEVSYPVRGDLGASTWSFTATGPGSIQLQSPAGTSPQLYAADGSYRAMTAMGGDRFTAQGAAAGVDVYPVLEGAQLAPEMVRAVAADDLHQAAPGYDYLIVAHPRLLESIAPLAQYHRAHGHRVALIDVDQVYDQFNDGIVHPVAIRNLVEWGTQHWQVKPHYLLLVGDASFDIHHDMRSNHPDSGLYALRAQPLRNEMIAPGGLSHMATTPYAQWDPDLPNRNLIPTWQFPTAEGQSASDNDFVALKPGDFHPQLAVGRLPVVEPAEVKAIVDKTIAYLSKPQAGTWHRDVTFISTNEIASFKEVSDKIAQGLDSRGFAVNSIYTNADGTDAGSARATLKDDLNKGSLLVHFIGHGGQFIWRVGPPAELFTLDDVSGLHNAGRYPMVLAMTCFSAPFDHPTDDSIGERFLREPDKGAVAVFAASWENWPDPANSKALIEQLLKPGQSVGDAILAVKAKAADRTFVQMYNLLGDPAVVLSQPQASVQFMRSAGRWDQRILVRLPGRDFGGDVDVDWIDAQGDTLESKHYQSRDVQFALSPPERATQVRVYSTDGRDARTAFGSFRLLPPAPPAPAVEVKPPAPVAQPIPAASLPVPQAIPPARNMHVGKWPDKIARMGFEAAPAQKKSAPSAPGAARHPAH
jgi:hypothetical protein